MGLNKDDLATMSSTPNTTPRFDNPPVVETVLGVQFEPLRSMRITHLGLFWEKIKERFPEVEHHRPLDPVKESFGKLLLEGGPRWRISDEPELPRAWFLSEENAQGQQLIQLQPDRFIQNWRRAGLQAQDYPSYEKNRMDFVDSFQRFLDFVEEKGLGGVASNQCEVTYVNHIVFDEDCNAGEMARKCFPSLAGCHSDSFLPSNAERVSFNCSYRIERDQGRLHIASRPITPKPGAVVLRLTLTARGAPESADVEDVMRWLDLGHTWVVNGFKSFTSEAMHKHWGIQKQ